VRRGLVARIKHHAWYYVDRGQRARACGVFFRGFALTGNGGLLVRALAAWIPGASYPPPTDRKHTPTLLARS
jgi:hypothetical protein